MCQQEEDELGSDIKSIMFNRRLIKNGSEVLRMALRSVYSEVKETHAILFVFYS